MITKNLNFKFKGNRKYVHGSDIYNMVSKDLIQYTKKTHLTNLKMNLKKQINKQCKVYIDENDENILLKKDIDIFAEIFVRFENKKLSFYLTEIGTPITESYSYDEELIEKSLVLKGDRAYLLDENEFSNIENIVSINKHLIFNVQPEKIKKWFFTSLDLHQSLDQFNIKDITLKFENILAASHSKTSICYKDKVLGKIFFSLV